MTIESRSRAAATQTAQEARGDSTAKERSEWDLENYAKLNDEADEWVSEGEMLLMLEDIGVDPDQAELVMDYVFKGNVSEVSLTDVVDIIEQSDLTTNNDDGSVTQSEMGVFAEDLIDLGTGKLGSNALQSLLDDQGIKGEEQGIFLSYLRNYDNGAFMDGEVIAISPYELRSVIGDLHGNQDRNFDEDEALPLTGASLKAAISKTVEMDSLLNEESLGGNIKADTTFDIDDLEDYLENADDEGNGRDVEYALKGFMRTFLEADDNIPQGQVNQLTEDYVNYLLGVDDPLDSGDNVEVDIYGDGPEFKYDVSSIIGRLRGNSENGTSFTSQQLYDNMIAQTSESTESEIDYDTVLNGVRNFTASEN